MGSSNLSMSIHRSRQYKKRKTSFLGNGKETRRRRTQSSAKAVSLGHVVFSGESSLNNGSSSMNSSSSSTTNLARSSSLPQGRSGKGLAPPSKKRSSSDTGRKGASLWAKVSSSGFKRRRG